MTDVVIAGGAARTFTKFMLPLLSAMTARGFRVTALAGDSDERVAAVLGSMGIALVRVPLGRQGLNPIADLVSLWRLRSFLRARRPQIFLGYTMKHAVYGVLAARMAGVPRRSAMFTGLGYAFTEGGGVKRRLVRAITTVLLKLSMPAAHSVIFLNEDDRDLLAGLRLVDPRRCAVVNGAGVDIGHFAPAPLPDGPVTFLMITRILRDKGIHEFVEAARMVKRVQPDARFVLVGPMDANPSAIAPAEVEGWVAEGLVDYRGEVADVRPAIAAAHVYVLPSYREGTPRTVLEAMAMGRPVITTDAPGCRQTIADGVNGTLVPPRDAAALAAAMVAFATAPDRIAEAGRASRARAEALYRDDEVALATLRAIAGR